MSKITKFAQKIFAKSASTDQISVFGSLFAGSPDFTTDPAEAQSLGNFDEGWNSGAIGGNAPAIEDMNSLFFTITAQLAYLVQQGVAEWDEDTVYYIGSIVNNAGVLYRSITDANTGNVITDTTNWLPYSTDVVGTGKDFWGSSLPSGYIWASGKTIGNASSNATERANADTIALFTMLWDNYSNTLLPIYTSAGIASTRGANAAADFAANKALAVIDKRGRVSAGKDDIGGTAASRLTGTTMTPNGTTLGAAGGTQTHTLVTGEMPSHTHSVTDPGHTHTAPQGLSGSGSFAFPEGGAALASVTGSSATGLTNQNTGGGGAHLNVQPAIACNYIIKL